MERLHLPSKGNVNAPRFIPNVWKQSNFKMSSKRGKGSPILQNFRIDLGAVIIIISISYNEAAVMGVGERFSFAVERDDIRARLDDRLG